MNKLKASIVSFIKLKASTLPMVKLKASVRRTVILMGSVSEFTRSLSMRIFITPIVEVYSKAYARRNARINIKSKVSIVVRMKAMKNLIANISNNSIVTARMSATKEAKANIFVLPIFGKRTILGFMDLKTLDDLDNLTLDDIEFTEGIVANVIKRTLFSVKLISNVSIDMYMFKYRKLEELDSMILGDLDILTLKDVEEVAS